jgi:hypothetical protein
MIADRDVTLMEDSFVFSVGSTICLMFLGKIGRQGVRQVRPTHL